MKQPIKAYVRLLAQFPNHFNFSAGIRISSVAGGSSTEAGVLGHRIKDIVSAQPLGSQTLLLGHLFIPYIHGLIAVAEFDAVLIVQHGVEGHFIVQRRVLFLHSPGFGHLKERALQAAPQFAKNRQGAEAHNESSLHRFLRVRANLIRLSRQYPFLVVFVA